VFSLTPGEPVAAGALLARLDVPEIASEEAIARARLKAIMLRLGRTSADTRDRDDALVLGQERAALQSRLAGLAAERRQLELRAPQAGRVVEVMSDLHPGRWLAAKQQIALVDGSRLAILNGYIAAADLSRVAPGAAGRFVPDDALEPAFDVALRTIAATGIAEVDIPELASAHGGAVAAEPDARQKLVPTEAQYRVTLDIEGPHAVPVKAIRGTAHLSGVPESFLARAWRRVLTVLVRESGA
ncbi:MAG: hypothetical protein ACT4N2_10440, partial [Hyphomicrobium sp.]